MSNINILSGITLFLPVPVNVQPCQTEHCTAQEDDLFGQPVTEHPLTPPPMLPCGSSMSGAPEESFVITPGLEFRGSESAFRTAGDDGILPGSTDVEVLDAEKEGQFVLLGGKGSALMHGNASAQTQTLQDMMLLGPVPGMPLEIQIPAVARHHHICSPGRGTLSPGSSRSIASAFSSQSALSSNIAGLPMFFGELGGQPIPGAASRMHLGSTSPSWGTSPAAIRSSRSLPCLSKLHDYEVDDDEDTTDPSDGGSESEPGREEGRTRSRPPSPTTATGSLPARRVLSRPRRLASRYEVELEREPVKFTKKRSGSGNQAGVTIPNPNGIACTACGAKVGQWMLTNRDKLLYSGEVSKFCIVFVDSCCSSQTGDSCVESGPSRAQDVVQCMRRKIYESGQEEIKCWEFLRLPVPVPAV